MKTTSFKDLIVWQKSMDLAKKIYLITLALPKHELYGISSQIQRSSVSIPSNIAEGYNRGSRKEYSYFLRLAYGSSAELETQLLIISDVYKNKEIEKCLLLNTEIQKILSTIIKKLK